MRLAVELGPVLQVCWLALLTWPDSATFALSWVQLLCPAELLH